MSLGTHKWAASIIRGKSSKIIASHLNAKHEICKDFIEGEAGEKHRRTIKAKTRVPLESYISLDIMFVMEELIQIKRMTEEQF